MLRSHTDGDHQQGEGGMGQRTATTVSYVYYDDGDRQIPPEAEGSVLMALGITEGQHGGEEEEEGSPAKDNGGEGARLAGVMEELEAYSEDADGFEARRVAALEWLTAHDAQMERSASSTAAAVPAKTAAESSPTTAPAVPATAPSSPPASLQRPHDEEEDEEECEEEEEGGMFTQFTREATFSDDEPWVLERIIKRRMYKPNPASDPTGVKEHQYYCKWKYYDEPTWEGRTLLEDEGYKGECDAYDGVVAAQVGGVQQRRGTAACAEDGSKNHGLDIDLNSPVEQIFKFHFTTEVSRLMAQHGASSLYYMSVAVPSRVKSFLDTWRRLSDTHTPTLLFHGTNSKNIISIVKNGLVVPGSCGVTVANGSAYGVGIYTAKTPAVSFGYCNQRNGHNNYMHWSGEMFACIGLVSNKDPKIRTACGGSYVIFFDASYIIPVGVVGWRKQEGIRADKRPIPRKSFNRCFDPYAPIAGGVAPGRELPSKYAHIANANAAAAGETIPSAYVGVPMTKRLLKECPRKIKDLYRAGALFPVKGKGNGK